MSWLTAAGIFAKAKLEVRLYHHFRKVYRYGTSRLPSYKGELMSSLSRVEFDPTRSATGGSALQNWAAEGIKIFRMTCDRVFVRQTIRFTL